MTRRIIALLLAALLLPLGCSRSAPSAAPVDFLKQHHVKVQPNPVRFRATVPTSWAVPIGAYPEGLFWRLANVFSQDAGLDLTRLQGQSVDVYAYDLADGLPGSGESAGFSYPSRAIVLVQNQGVVGAWLAFNLTSVGPSVRGRDLQAITGVPFDQWVERERIITPTKGNADLAQLGPTEVLSAFLDAVTVGDRTRAHACLSPSSLLGALTMNLDRDRRLYNPGFKRHNSMVVNLKRGRLLSAKLADADSPGTPIAEVGSRTRVEIAAEVELVWTGREALFNTPTGRTIRFAIMDKTSNGWKLSGLGTGP